MTYQEAFDLAIRTPHEPNEQHYVYQSFRGYSVLTTDSAPEWTPETVIENGRIVWDKVTQEWKFDRNTNKKVIDEFCIIQ